jgi:hypothetical protein
MMEEAVVAGARSRGPVVLRTTAAPTAVAPRLGRVVLYTLACLTTAGLVYGYAALKPVLASEGVRAWPLPNADGPSLLLTARERGGGRWGWGAGGGGRPGVLGDLWAQRHGDGTTPAPPPWVSLHSPSGGVCSLRTASPSTSARRSHWPSTSCSPSARPPATCVTACAGAEGATHTLPWVVGRRTSSSRCCRACCWTGGAPA